MRPTWADRNTHTLCLAYTHSHTHTLHHWGSAVLCCVSEVAFVGWAEFLCPLWQGLRVSAAACCLSLGHRLLAGPTTNLPEPLPTSWRHPGWSCFMRLWQGPAQISLPLLTSPPHWLPQQPQTTLQCSKCGAPLKHSRCWKLDFSFF